MRGLQPEIRIMPSDLKSVVYKREIIAPFKVFGAFFVTVCENEKEYFNYAKKL